MNCPLTRDNHDVSAPVFPCPCHAAVVGVKATRFVSSFPRCLSDMAIRMEVCTLSGETVTVRASLGDAWETVLRRCLPPGLEGSVQFWWSGVKLYPAESSSPRVVSEEHDSVTVQMLRVQPHIKVWLGVPASSSYDVPMGLFAEVLDAEIPLPLDMTSVGETRLSQLKEHIAESQQTLPPDTVGYAALLSLSQCLEMKQVARRRLDEFPHSVSVYHLAVIFGERGPRLRAKVCESESVRWTLRLNGSSVTDNLVDDLPDSLQGFGEFLAKQLQVSASLAGSSIAR